MLLSVGLVGPGGGIYPIIYDVVCKINFQKQIWRPNNCGYMQLCPCLWALSLFFLNILCTQHTLYLNISHLRANSCGYMQLCLCLWALSGPEVGYIIIDDVVSKVNFLKLIWRPNNRGYMQLCLCLWALSLFFKYTLYTTYPIIEYITPPGKQLWIFAVMLMSVGPVGPGGGIYSIVEDAMCIYFQQNRFGDQ